MTQQRVMDDDALTDPLTRGICPDCGSRGFVIGPMGGSALNIECADTGCRSRFNTTFFSGECLMAQRIERASTWPSEPRNAADAGLGLNARARQMLVDSERAFVTAKRWLMIGSVLMILSVLLLIAQLFR